MNFYPFHVGDYASHTAHLEPMEDLAYRRMLDLYYLREAPLPNDVQEVARLIRMRNNLAEVESVLNEFFILTDIGWSSDRCQNELCRMLDKQTKAKASDDASVSVRSAKKEEKEKSAQTDVQRPLNERSTDAERTLNECRATNTNTNTNTKDKTIRAPRFDARAHLVSIGIAPDLSDDWLKLRKAKRAEVTKTAIDGIQREADRACVSLETALRECCSRGWAGFKAEWMERAAIRASPSFQTVGDKREQTILALTGRVKNDVIEGGFVHVAG